MSSGIKALSVVLILVLILNLLLLPAGKISLMNFWIVIIAIGLFAFFVMPRLKKG